MFIRTIQVISFFIFLHVWIHAAVQADIDRAYAPNGNYTLFQQRQQTLIKYGLQHPSEQSLIIQAKEGIPLDQSYLTQILTKLPTNKNADFDLTKLTRCLYYNISTSDKNQILSSIKQLQPFWLTPNQSTFIFWTENHQIQWMSSAFLLNQKYNLTIDKNLHSRLKIYLQLKLNYSFYEWFSATYFPYTMNGLINLAEFAIDTSIQNLSIQVLEKHLIYLLKAVNNKGLFYPVTARAHNFGKYTNYNNPYAENSVQVMYMLTGLGENTLNTSIYDGSSFLAVSDVNLSNVVNSYQDDVYEVLHFGNGINQFETLKLFKNLTLDDRTTFQMSAGCYANNPYFINDTLRFLFDYEIKDSKMNKMMQNFGIVKQYNNIDSFDNQRSVALSLWKVIEPLTTGSIITNNSVMIYKNGPSIISSIVNYSHPGSLDYEIVPFVASTGSLTMFLVSGNGTSQTIMSYLPQSKQIKNVAMIKFDRLKIEPYLEIEKIIYGITTPSDVFLYFPLSLSDEYVVYNNWIVGREENGYIGVRRDTQCTMKNSNISDVISCDEMQQVYSFIVGNNVTYTSFEQFQNVIKNSTYDEKMNQLDIDGVQIEMGPNW